MGKIVWKPELDLSLIYRQIKEFEKKIESSTIDVKFQVDERSLNNVQSQINRLFGDGKKSIIDLSTSIEQSKKLELQLKNIGKTKISPIVDRQSLERLNKDLATSYETIKLINQSSIAPNVDNKPINLLSSAIEKIQIINEKAIVPKVDHKPLVDLNKHLDIKTDHWDNTVGHIAKNPIVPKIDTSGAMLALDELEFKLSDVIKKAKSTPIVVNTGIDINTAKGLDPKNQSSTGVTGRDFSNNKFASAVASFQKSTNKFEKANKKTLLGSVTRGAFTFIGQSIGQLLVLRLGALLAKQSTKFLVGNNAPQWQQKYLPKVAGLAAEGQIASKLSTKQLERLLSSSFIIGRSLEQITDNLAQTDSRFASDFQEAHDRLSKIDGILAKTYTDVKISAAIHTTLKGIKSVLAKGLAKGFAALIGSAVQKALSIPARIFAGSFDAAGNAQGQLGAVPFSTMMNRVLGDRSNTQKRQESSKQGFLVGAAIKGVQSLPAILGGKAGSAISKTFEDRIAPLIQQLKDKIGLGEPNPDSAFNEFKKQFSDLIVNIQDKVNTLNESTLSIAEGIVGQSFSEIEQAIKADIPVTTEELLAKISGQINKILISINRLGGFGNTGVTNESSPGQRPPDSQTIASKLFGAIDRLKRQGSRSNEGVTEGGIYRLSRDLPQLGLKTSGKNINSLKTELKQAVQKMADGGQLEELTNFSEYIVRNWDKLAHQNHRNYAPDMNSSGINNRLEFGDNTDQIQSNWKATGDQLVSELRTLVEQSKKAGYQVQRNISEGSPGVTKNIRSNWKKTIAFIIKQIDGLLPVTAQIGKKIQQNFSQISSSFSTGIDRAKKLFNGIKMPSFGGSGESSQSSLNFDIAGKLQKSIDGMLAPLNAIASANKRIQRNLNQTVTNLKLLTEVSDLNPIVISMKESFTTLRFKLLRNGVKALKALTKFLDFTIDLDDGWKKNIVRLITRSLYQLTKTTIRELGIATGQIAKYAIRDIRSSISTLVNSDRFSPIRQDIDSFVGQIQDVVKLLNDRFSKIKGFFGVKQEPIAIPNKQQYVEPPKDPVYFDGLFKALYKSLNQISQKGRKKLGASAGIETNSTQSPAEFLELLIKKIQLDPTALKTITNQINDQWDDIAIGGGKNPLKTFAHEIDDIDKKWHLTGNYFHKVLKKMTADSAVAGDKILHYLAEGSPGLTQDIRFRWRETTADVGKSMAKMTSHSESSFERITQLLDGVKISGSELAGDTLSQLSQKFSNVAKDLANKGEVKLFDLLGIGIKDISQVDQTIAKIAGKFETLQQIQLDDSNGVLSQFTNNLDRNGKVAFKAVKNNLKQLGEQRKAIESTLANPPAMTGDNGELDKRAVIKYIFDLQSQIGKYQANLGGLTQSFKVNPNFQKALNLLPLESRREFNKLFSSVKKGFGDVSTLSDMVADEVRDIFDLNPQSLKALGIPEQIIAQIDNLINKSKEAQKAIDLSNFKMPSAEGVTKQAERALVNIFDKQSRVKDIRSELQSNQQSKKQITGNIAKTKARFTSDYKRLIEAGKTAEAKALKDSYQDYLKAKAEQIKAIKAIERRYAKEIGDIAISLGDFDNESQIVGYIKGFKNFSTGLDGLVDRVVSANDELKESVITTSNSITSSVDDYESSQKAIVNIQSQINKLENKKGAVTQQFDNKKQKAQEKNDLTLLARIEENRRKQLQGINAEQAKLTQSLQQQRQIADQARGNAFNQRNTIVNANSVYETETAEPQQEQNVSLLESLKQVLGSIPSYAKQAFGSLTKGYDRLKANIPTIQNLEDAMKRVGLQVGVLAVGVSVGFGLIGKAIASGVQTALQKLQELSAQTFRMALDFESLQSQFTFVFGSGKGLPMLDAIRNQSDDLGLSFKKMQGQFVQFTMGLQSARLDPYALEMFEGVQKGLLVRGSTGESADRALVALTQMANKGRVSLEELTGQLGEALPGALQVASQAMGKNTSELITMVESGRLLAEDFLPKFTAALARQADPFIAGSLETGEAKIAKLGNSIAFFQERLGTGALDIAKPLIDGLNNALKFFLEFSDKIAVVGTAIGISFFAPLLKQLTPALSKMKKGFTGFFDNLRWQYLDAQLQAEAGLTKLQLRTLGVTKAIKAQFKSLFVTLKTGFVSLATTFAPIVALTVAFETIRGIFDTFNTESKATAKELQGRLEQIRNYSAEEKTTDNLKTGNFVLDITDRFINKPLGLNTNAENQYASDVIQSGNAFNALLQGTSAIENNVNQNGGLDNYINEKARIEKEIEINAATIQGLKAINTVGAKEEVQALKELNFARQKELDTLEKAVFPMGDFNTELDRYKTEFERLQVLIDKGKDPLGKYKQQQDLVNGQIQALTRRISNMNDQLEEAKGQFGNLVKELKSVAIASEAVKFENSLASTQARTSVLKEQLANGTPNNTKTQLSLASVDVATAQNELARLRNESTQLAQAIANTQDQQSVTSLLTLLQAYDENITSLNDVTYKAILQAESNTKLDESQKGLLDQVKRQSTLRSEVANAEEGLLRSQVSILDQQIQANQSADQFVRSLEDLDVSVKDFVFQRNRQVEDFSRQYQQIEIDVSRQNRDLFEQYSDLGTNLESQINKAQSEIEKLNQDILRQSLANEARSSLTFGGDGLFSGLIDFFTGVQSDIDGLNSEQYSLEEQRLEAERSALDISRQIRGLSEQREDLERSRYDQLLQLARQQEDFVRSQAQTWVGITRQIEDMERQGRSMGLNFDSIADNITNISSLFEQVYQQVLTMQQSVTLNDFNQGSIGGGDDYIDIAAELLKKEEGFREKAYWDVNEFRVGYGTEFRGNTPSAYNIHSTMTKEEADKQLKEYDIPRFVTKIVGQIGEGIWNDLSENAKAGLVSVAYNYGSLPKQVVSASKSGDIDKIANAIASLSDNKARRKREAELLRTPNTQFNQSSNGVPFFLKNKGVNDFSSGFNATRVRKDGVGRHNGNDYVVPDGTQVFSAITGKVTSTYSDKGEHGLHVTSLDGKVVTQLNHLMKLNVKDGDMVKAGQLLGLSGGSKRSWGSTGSHLDAKVKVNGSYIPVEQFFADPTKYFNPNFSPSTISPQINRSQIGFTPRTQINPMSNRSMEDIARINVAETARLIEQYAPEIFKSGSQELENLLKIKEVGDAKALEALLEQKGITLKQLSDFKVQLQLKERETRIAENRLRKEKELKQQIDQVQETIKSINDEYSTIEEAVKNLTINAKGYLTYEEQYNKLVKDDLKQYEEQLKVIDELQEKLTKLADSDNPEASKKAIEAIQTNLQTNEGLLSPEFFTKSQELIDQASEGFITIDQLREKLKQLGEEVDFATTIATQTAEMNAQLEVSNRYLSEMRSILDGLGEAYRFSSEGANLALLSLANFDTENKFEELRKQATQTLDGIKSKAEKTRDDLQYINLLEGLLKGGFDEQEAIEKRINRIENEYNSESFRLNQTSDIYGFVGDRLSENSLFGGLNEKAIAEQTRILGEYASRIRDIDVAIAQEGENTAFADRLKAVREQLIQLRDSELEDIPSKINNVIQGIGRPIEGFFTSLFGDFIRGQATLQDMFVGFLGQVGNFFAQLAAQMVANQAIGFLGQLFGVALGAGVSTAVSGVGSGFAGGTGTAEFVAPTSIGIADKGLSLTPAMMSNLSGNPLALGLAVQQAMKEEGSGAIPVVGHVGEMMISRKTGDAQLMKSLMRSGEWSRMKNSYSPNMKVKNYKFGGPIGSGESRIFNGGRSDNSQTYNDNRTYNINSSDANGVKRSLSQLSQEETLRRERAIKYQT